MTTEKTTFDGNRYKISVASDESTGYLEISAVCKGSGRRSCITNLNFVLREFIEPIMGAKFVRKVEDSDICVKDKKKHAALVGYISQYFEEAIYGRLAYLEDALDEDRANGEWESFEGHCDICGKSPPTHSFVDEHDDSTVVELDACADCHENFTYPCSSCHEDIHVDVCKESEVCPSCGGNIGYFKQEDENEL